MNIQGQAEGWSGTVSETDSDSDGGESTGDLEWESSVLKWEEGDEPSTIEEDKSRVFRAILLQLSLKQGIQEWGDTTEKLQGRRWNN